MKCILMSFFNSNNLGDILIGDTLNQIVSKKFNVEKVSYSGSLDEIQDSNVRNKNKKNTSIKLNIIKLFKKNGFGFIVRFYYKHIKKIDIKMYENKISQVDALIIGGGNMIFDLDKYSSSASRFDKFVSIAKKNGLKIFAISLGIGPFQTKKQHLEAVHALEKCDYITFRDRASYEIFKKYNKTHNNVYVSVDPVFLLPQKVNLKVQQNRSIGLNIINNKLLSDSIEDYNASISKYTQLADALTKSLNRKVILFSTELSDYEAVKDVYEALKQNRLVEIRFISTIDELYEFYDEISVLIGTRMHSMIIALTQRIPIVGLSWQRKVDSLFDIIDSQDQVFSYRNMESHTFKIVEMVRRLYNNLEDEKVRIDNIIKSIDKKNEINYEILTKIQNV